MTRLYWAVSVFVLIVYVILSLLVSVRVCVLAWPVMVVRSLV